MSLSTAIPASSSDASYGSPMALPKSRSSVSLKSTATSMENDRTSASPTLCSLERAEGIECNAGNSREILFLDLSPADLDISEALGTRAPETIECVRINRCRMTGEFFASTVDSLCQFDLPNLHTVDISQNHVGGAKAAHALHKLLTHAPAIRFLYLGWNQLALADLKYLATFPSHTFKISYLDLRSNPLSTASQKRKGKNGSLAKTAISNNVSCAKWIDGLVDSLPDLTHVLMAQASIDDQTLSAFMCALTRPQSHVEYIGLEWVGLGSRLATLNTIMNGIAPLPSDTLARPLHLNLASNDLGDSGAEIISHSSARLTSITLACNFITERGTGFLAKWLLESGLTSLDLSDNYFGDQGIVSLLDLATVRKSPDTFATQLRSLGLNSCCLSDVSLRMLGEALEYKWAPLETLRILRNSRISPGAKIAV
ncbi:NACHT, LRR and PYD domains-containing protein 13 [Coemansia sp. RSA 1646]|nr:NACHT, LRR and PYD domains-containing protein 13 [Coemansia sp. RSA 1646]KAJ2092707.1 NACHT, LRR and PYD domains-containing protein 13 [Coemansia sp. RSA 986]